jgi:glycine betaine catabolism A
MSTLRQAHLHTPPLAADALTPTLAPDLSAARTLPAAAYLDPDVLRWERTHLFDAAWICVGRGELVPEQGSQCAIALGQAGILLVRDGAGQVRAFHNTCRHRGHELLRVGESRRKRAIACPYHAWVYSLEGELVRASRFANACHFDPVDFPLVAIRTEEWLGWIFVNLSDDAPDFAGWTGSLAEHLAPWEPDRLRLGTSHEYAVQANWKLIFENFVECYHCPSIHPELCRVADPDSGTAMFPHDGLWMGGPAALINGAVTQSLDGTSSATPFRRLADEQLGQVRYYTLFPNLLISPHPDYVMTHRLMPVSPGETLIECSWYFSPESVTRPDFDPAFATDFWHRTNTQDFTACESVMRGLNSPGYRPGPFDGREAVVHAFQRMVAQAYLSGRLEPPARVGQRAA